MQPEIPKYRCILGSLITYVLIPLYYYFTNNDRSTIKDLTAAVGFCLIASTFAFWKRCTRKSIASLVDHALAAALVLLLTYQYRGPLVIGLAVVPYLLSYYYNQKNNGETSFVSMMLWLFFRVVIFWHMLLVIAPNEVTFFNLLYYNGFHALHIVSILYTLPESNVLDYYAITNVMSIIIVILVLKLRMLIDKFEWGA